MPFVETQWWSVEIPEEWEAEHSEDCVSIVDCDDVGSLDISALKKEQGDITKRDIAAFAADALGDGLVPKSIEFNGFSGLYVEYTDTEYAWREWFLAMNELFIYATYHCDVENKGFDHVVVDEILQTLTLTDDEEGVAALIGKGD